MLFLVSNLFFQDRKVIDSLKADLSTAKPDKAKFLLLNNLSIEYNQFSEDTSIIYLKQALDLARDFDNSKHKA